MVLNLPEFFDSMLLASGLPYQPLPWLSTLSNCFSPHEAQVEAEADVHGILIFTTQTQKQFFQRKEEKRKREGKGQQMQLFQEEKKKQWTHIYTNEPKATLNYSPLGTEADTSAKFKMKSHIPPDPFLVITV